MLFVHQEPEFLERLQKVAEDLAKACVKIVQSGVQKAHMRKWLKPSSL